MDAAIVQVNRVAHTGASGRHRLAHPPLFEGEVAPGRAYVLVDDFIGQGATLANLRGHIEAAGGTVVAAIALRGKLYSASPRHTTARTTEGTPWIP